MEKDADLFNTQCRSHHFIGKLKHTAGIIPPPPPPPPHPSIQFVRLRKYLVTMNKLKNVMHHFKVSSLFWFNSFLSSVLFFAVYESGGKITPGSRRFPPEMQKRAPKNCHSLQRKSLFNVADLANGMWKVAPENEKFNFWSGMNYSKLLF